MMGCPKLTYNFVKAANDYSLKAPYNKTSNDYYPFGSPLPGRQLIVGDQYEHGYQGQFTERDEETGLDAFKLRMWDSCLARWHSTDPYWQFHSPYLGMGNNPVSQMDPDGGWSWTMAAAGAVAGGTIAGFAAPGKKFNWKAAAGGALIGGALVGSLFNGELRSLRGAGTRHAPRKGGSFARKGRYLAKPNDLAFSFNGFSAYKTMTFAFEVSDKSRNKNSSDFFNGDRHWDKTIGDYTNRKGQTLSDYYNEHQDKNPKYKLHSYSAPFENHMSNIGTNGKYTFQILGKTRMLRGGAGTRLFNLTYDNIESSLFSKNSRILFKIPKNKVCDCYDASMKIKIRFKK